MTIVAWDGKKLVSDSRIVIKHYWDGHNALSEVEVEHLKTVFNQDWWHVSNTQYEVTDGAQKIFVPAKNKPLYYRGERVQAIGISGEVAYLETLGALKRGTELTDPSCFINHFEASSHFLVITPNTVYDHQIEMGGERYKGSFFVTSTAREKFVSIGSGSMPSFNGTNPGLDSESYVDFACHQSSLSGGPKWVWDSATGELELKPAASFKDVTGRLMAHYQKEVLHLRMAARINNSVKDTAKSIAVAKDLATLIADK
jgi:hypothetical protein